jgi:hypothetical protein
MLGKLASLGKTAAAAPVAAPKKASILSSLTASTKAATADAADTVATAGVGTALGLSGTQTTALKQLEKGTGTSTTGLLSSTKTFFGTTLPNAAKATGTWFYNGINPMVPSTWLNRFGVIFIMLLLVAVIVLPVLYMRGYFNRPAAPQAVGNSLNAATANAPKAVEKFTDTPQPVSPDAYTLVNLQPRTIKQVGYLGPLPEGRFDVANAVGQTLRAGFRSFVFQIDYLDTSRGDAYGGAGVPLLLYRGDDGSLLSKNSADIKDVATSIANLAFRPEVPNYTEPILIYLHILRAPSAVRDPDGYTTFLSKIAASLNPLAPNHLGMTPLGSFNRQKQESTLINTPLSSFEGQVIVLCNADTSIFRNSTEIDPANDLDFWVNMRVYLNSSGDTIGITQPPPAGVTPSAVVVPLPSLLNLSSQKMDSFAAQAKHQFIIAIPSQSKNVSDTQLNTAINILGINIVPIDIFSDPIDKVHALSEEYSNMTFRPKSAVLRNA